MTVQVTPAAGGGNPPGGGDPPGGGAQQPPLARTGISDPTPILWIGAWLIGNGLILMLMSRPRHRATN